MTRVFLSHGVRLVLLAALALASPGAAQPGPSPLLRPGQLDARLDGAASLLPLSLETGATVDVGVLSVSSGTLALGAAVSANLCALACWVPNLFSERHTSRWELSAVGRLGYHVTVANRRGTQADVSGFLLGGVTEPRTTVSTPEYRFEGRGRGAVFGLGLGGSYFPSPRFFLGGEARVRFSTGTVEPRLTRGTHDFTAAEREWLRFGLSTAFFVGMRLF